MANHPIFYPTFDGHLDVVRKILEADVDLVNVRDAKNAGADARKSQTQGSQ